MDFSTQDKSAEYEAGRAFDITDPFTGEPMADENGPAQFIIRHPASKSSRAAAKRLAQEQKDAKPDMTTLASIHENNVKLALPQIVGFKNVQRDGREATVADAEWFLNLSYHSYVSKKGGGVEQINKTFAEQVSAAQEKWQREEKKG
jgi:hypothetical protein